MYQLAEFTLKLFKTLSGLRLPCRVYLLVLGALFCPDLKKSWVPARVVALPILPRFLPPATRELGGGVRKVFVYIFQSFVALPTHPVLGLALQDSLVC